MVEALQLSSRDLNPGGVGQHFHPDPLYFVPTELLGKATYKLVHESVPKKATTAQAH
jgi:hypothetical protein